MSPAHTRWVTAATGNASSTPRLRCGIVLRVEEDACQVLTEDADVELSEVERLYTEHGMWASALDP